MLSLHGVLNLEKALLIATLLKAEGDIYEDQGNPDAAYDSYLTSLNLFLEIVLCDDKQHDLRCSAEVEALLGQQMNCLFRLEIWAGEAAGMQYLRSEWQSNRNGDHP